MQNWIRNTAAFFAGLVIGSVVNMMIVVSGSSLIPTPDGVDVTNADSIRASLHLFESKHFVMPFLAHAVGTLAGSLVAFMIAKSHQLFICMFIGVVFLLGGIAASMMIPAPTWVITTDLLFAYVPMAWLGLIVGRRLK